MEPISLGIILTYVADKFLAQFIKEEGYSRIREFFFPKQKYVNRLKDILHTTINQYQKENPYDRNLKKIPFYFNQYTFDTLTKYVLFNSKNHNLVIEEFKKDERIIIPTKKEIDDFFNFFVNNLKQDKLLRKLHIEEKYKEEIFNLSIELESLTETTNLIKKDTSNLLSQFGFVAKSLQAIAEKFDIELEISNFILEDGNDLHPLVNNSSKRLTLVQKYSEYFGYKDWLAIVGGIGMGKTQLAVLLTQNFEGDKYWISLRDTNSSNFLFKILLH